MLMAAADGAPTADINNAIRDGSCPEENSLPDQPFEERDISASVFTREMLVLGQSSKSALGFSMC